MVHGKWFNKEVVKKYYPKDRTMPNANGIIKTLDTLHAFHKFFNSSCKITLPLNEYFI